MDGTKRGSEADDFELLVRVLPEPLQRSLRLIPENEVLEVVLDLGRVPEARLVGGSKVLSDAAVRQEELDFVSSRVGAMGTDNRAGIERTLHRISAIRNRQGKVVGLTLRVGRAIFGTIETLRDLVESGLNVLLLGRPGVGKTTKLREMARVLADDFHKRVMVVDTSNEIGGDGDIPHPGIGSARRMQVSRPDRQHDVMIEAVENHMPEVIIVDEIGREAEAAAARTIAERGVQLIATAHGNTLENLVLNPTLSDLVGGVHTVTLSDDEARRRGTQKTVRERRAPPTFDIVVEMVDRDEVLVHPQSADSVDRLLAGAEVGGERRRRQPDGEVLVEEVSNGPVVPSRMTSHGATVRGGPARGMTARSAPAHSGRTPPRLPVPVPRGAMTAPPSLTEAPQRIYAHAVSGELIQRVLRDLNVRAKLVKRLDQAEVILALRSRSSDPKVRRALERAGLRILAVKRNSTSEIRRVLRELYLVAPGYDEDEVRQAVLEAEHAIRRVTAEGVSVPLAPRPPALRRLQHRLAARFHLDSTSIGSEPGRHLVFFPPGSARAFDVQEGTGAMDLSDEDGDRDEEQDEEGEEAGSAEPLEPLA